MTIKEGETYLGDGLYASVQGNTIWLRAPQFVGDHTVALEPEVWEALVQFQQAMVKRLQQRRGP
jgi:hypothetical protein